MNKLLLRVLGLSAFFILAATTVFATETVIKTGTDQPVTATLTFSASPLKSMTEIPFLVDFDNKDIHIQSAACSLTMPAMAMPDNHPKLTCTEHSCTGKAIFTMAGAWQSTFGLIMQDGSHTSIVFDIDMVQMK